MRTTVRGLLLGGLTLALAACGGRPPTPRPVTVEVTLAEFSIASSRTAFEVGVPYRFVITNAGHLAHEWIIAPRGSTDDSEFLAEVEEEELPPGATAEYFFTLEEAGDFEFACHVPGHYEAGMVLITTVQ